MSVRKFVLLFAGLFAASAVSAQFHSTGDDPGQVRWNVARSAHYKLLYPRGMDSLARTYARALEAFYPDEGRTIGYLPGSQYSRPLPVVLHPFGGESNGSVAWAPMRMDLFTLPDPYDPEPLPWPTNLAVHESRHAAQMQFGADGLFRPFKWILGEMFAGAMAGVYPSTWFLEGDAVVAETALTAAGRGRSGAFMAYYQAAFDRGDFRNWYRWRYGSYRLQAPNHYALGYMSLAGVRYLYDDPLFASDYLRGVARHPWRFFNTRRSFREASGKKFSEAFDDIMHTFHALWTEDAARRGPFTEGDLMTAVPSWYTTWSAPLATDGGLIAKQSSKIQATRLVSLDENGQVRPLRTFAAASGDIRTDGERLYWSETVPDLRWSLKATSRIRYMEPDGKVRDLTRRGRLYNPSPSPDGSRIAVTEYPTEGGSRLLLLDRDGITTAQLTAPDGVQFVESVWGPCPSERSESTDPDAGDSILYFSFLNDEGLGIGRWTLSDEARFETVLAPRPVSLAHLQGDRSGICFVTDRSGVGEVCRLTPQGTLIQLTATRYGVTNYTFQGDTLCYTALTADGELPFKAAPDKLLYRQVDFGDLPLHPVADKLAAQERELGMTEDRTVSEEDPFLAEPKRYNKLAGIPHIHSWAPLRIDYNQIENLSADNITKVADIGATVFFQNLLGTSSGQLSYGYVRDTYTGKRRHSGHLNLTYSGLYPVFELTVDAGDRDLIQYSRVRQETDGLSVTSVSGRLVDCPSVRAGLKMYVPLNFSKGGWSRGLIPQISYTVTNDRFNKTLPVRTPVDAFEKGLPFTSLSRVESGKNLLMQLLTVSVRGYVFQRTPAALEYPRWGIGMEAGYHTRVGLDDLYSSGVYGYAYGYLPGIVRNQGLRLSALYQRQNGAPTGENFVNTRPRGYLDTQLLSFLSSHAPGQLKLTADYAVPIYVGDISWFAPLAYIKNFMVKPHVDFLHMEYGRGLAGTGSLVSLGGEFTVRMANFLWLPYDTTAGFTFDWNGGPSYGQIAGFGYRLERTYIGGIFSVSF